MVVKAVIVFLVTAALDATWAFFIRKTSQGRAFSAASFGALSYVLGAIATVMYVKQPWLIAIAALGGFLGTYVTVWWDHRRKKAVDA